MGIQLDRVINENYEKLNTVDQHILQFVQGQSGIVQKNEYCGSGQTLQCFHRNHPSHSAKAELQRLQRIQIFSAF